MSRTTSHALTLIVPTFNRCRFLGRLLDYYAHKGFRHPILIADSSYPDAAATNQAAIRRARQSIDITYQRFDSRIPVGHKFVQAVDRVSTEFAGFCADDDFICPSAIDQCLTFMQGHPDYSAAQGSSVAFTIQPMSNARHFAFYPQKLLSPLQLDQDDPAERLLGHLSNYFPTFYAIHRRSDLLANLQKMNDCTDEDWFGELLPSCLTVIQGKVRRFTNLYTVRESHAHNLAWASLPWERFLLNEHFSRRYIAFRDATAAALAAARGEDANAAQQTVELAFQNYNGNRFRRAGLAVPNLRTDSTWGVPGRLVRAVKRFGSIADWLRKTRVRVGVAPWQYLTVHDFRAELSLIERLVLEHHTAA